MTPEKTKGTLHRNKGGQGNTFSIRNEEGKSYGEFNVTKIKNTELTKAFKEKRYEWNVQFLRDKPNKADPSSIEIIPDEIESRDEILKNVSELRLSGEDFSSLDNLAKGLTICSTSSSSSSTTVIPTNARKIEIKDIIEKAEEGVDEKKLKEIKELRDKKELKCPACGKSEHSEADPMSFSTWYYLNETSHTEEKGLSLRAIHRLKELTVILSKRPYCECGLKAVPRSPVNIFRRVSPLEKETIDKQYEGEYAKKLRSIDDKESFNIKLKEISRLMSKESKESEESSSSSSSPTSSSSTSIISSSSSSSSSSVTKPSVTPQFDVLGSIKDKQRINHIVPRSGGGCPKKTFDILAEFEGKTVPPANLIPIWNMCPLCQLLDELFTKWQDEQKYSIHEYIANVINKKSKD